MKLKLLLVLGLVLAGVALPAWSKSGKENVWESVLRNQYFAGRTIEESEAVIELSAPYRAEDPALVPVRITSKIPQTAETYIKTITLFIDNNPVPFSGRFHFTPASGKADLALRVRVNAYTNIRAIAELNDGRLVMHKVFVKASGGCSAPLGADLEAAMARLGKMRFRLGKAVESEQPVLAQLMISHPNITGLQMDQVSRLYRPPHFVKEMVITFNGQRVLTAETDIALSADPNFRFYFVPEQVGELKAEITDSKGLRFSESYEVEP